MDIEKINHRTKYLQFIDEIGSAWKGHANFAIDLVDILKPNTIVDLGVDFGFSTFCFAYPRIGNVYGIDSFQGDPQTGIRDTHKVVCDFISKINTNIEPIRVQIIRGFFDDVAKTWDLPIDLLHIDGLHAYEAVKNDYETWSSFCNEDSVILFHDTESYSHTVGKFFDELDGFKTNMRGSAGLGVFTKSEKVFKTIKTLCDFHNLKK
jgi:hypothetical protein